MRLGRLAFNAVAFPVIMELTRGQPMVRLFQGMHNAPGSGGGAILHSNREGQRSSTVGSPSMAKYIVGRDGTIFCQDFVVFVYLDDVNAGDGGVCMVPASHKVRGTPLSPWSRAQLAVRTTSRSTLGARLGSSGRPGCSAVGAPAT